MHACFLCAQPAGADAAALCAGCQQRLAPPVRATGEFMAPTAAMLEIGASSPAAAVGGGCTWCGRGSGEVQKLLGNGTVQICNECVALCADVMQAELGEGWRG